MRIETPIPFWKMHGSGNDFLVVSLPNDNLNLESLGEFTRNVCRRGMGLNTDGVIFIAPSAEEDFDWRYINADGTEGEMCGNGAMVGARYAVELGIAPASCAFNTPSGVVHAEVRGEHVSLRMINARQGARNLVFDAMPGVAFDWYEIGVPHVVGFVNDADAVINLDTIGRSIRHDPQLQPAGANVNLVHRMNDHTIRMRTYERGVESETLACGTGAVCSAIAAVRRGMVVQPVTVRASSGMELTVSWRDSGEIAVEITLAGIARIVARGELLPEAMF